MNFNFSLSLFFVVVFLTTSCLAQKQRPFWGVDGHQIVAQIAWDRLSSSIQQKITSYIDDPSLNFTDIATQADTYRMTPEGAWSDPLHYVDMLNGSVAFEYTDCPATPGCVVSAITNFTDYLARTLVNPKWGNGEPSPLAFLVHFVGDVHQPLHVGWAYDRGGNDVEVNFFGEDTNLHEVWDVSIIVRWEPFWPHAATLLEEMISNEPSVISGYLQVTSPSDWATESFTLVRTDVYNFNPKDQEKGPHFYTPYLGNNYYNQNLPIVQQQLIKAGVRLAALLEKLFS